jgi:peptide/nickel transport system substrate-binding protein
MSGKAVQRLLADVRAGRIHRRAFVQRATAMGMSAAAAGILARSASAQEATPAATPAGAVTTSITRDEYVAQLEAAFPFEAAQSEGGQVILASTADIATLNPVIRSDVIALYAISNIFSYLAIQSPIDGAMAPDLADYWELDADGVTYTFHLNQDATWHDGKPVTAHDVVLTFDAVMGEDSISPVGSEFMGSIASYGAVDDHTFELVGKEPSALILEKTVAAIAIMPKHIWGSIPFAEWGSAPGSTGTDPAQVIGSGPFRFKEWVLGDHVTIERNEEYWLPDRVPHIDAFTIRVIGEAESAVQSVIVGESDTMRGMSPTQIDRVRSGNPEIETVTFDDMSWVFFLMNADAETGTFFADAAVRQAMMYAVDRDLIVNTMLGGLATPAVGVQPPGSPAYAPDAVTTVYTLDPDKSRAMLDEAGWVDSDRDGIREKDGVTFSMDFQYSDSAPVNEQLVPYLRQAFGEVGVEIVPRVLPQTTLMEQVIAGNYQMSTLKIFWTLDDQGVLYRCDAIPPAGFNLARHCNSEYDRLNTESQTELDPAKRRALMIDQGNISNDDAHYGLLYFGQSVVPVNSRVRNMFYSAFNELWSLTEVWVEAR